MFIALVIDQIKLWSSGSLKQDCELQPKKMSQGVEFTPPECCLTTDRCLQCTINVVPIVLRKAHQPWGGASSECVSESYDIFSFCYK